MKNQDAKGNKVSGQPIVYRIFLASPGDVRDERELARLCRSASRRNFEPDYRDDDVGFRLARSVTLGPLAKGAFVGPGAAWREPQLSAKKTASLIEKERFFVRLWRICCFGPAVFRMR